MAATPANSENIAGAKGVVLFDGTATFSTANGTSGQVLTANGTSSQPTFQAAGSVGSSLVLIQSQVASSSSTIDFTTNTNIYNTYFFTFFGVQPGTNASRLIFRISNNAGSTYVTAGYQSGYNFSAYNSNTVSNVASTGQFDLSSVQTSGDANKTTNGQFYIHNCNVGAKSYLIGQAVYFDSSGGVANQGWSGGQAGDTGANAFRFLMDSGNIAAGTFNCYGLRIS